ncbi:acyltransferase [Lactococcus carnosus]|uniref:acyltransferase n=1 Tax=Pseudolactococcus carnosus TaxID=2749961 RepID=UPI001FBA5E9F|nr:acyltransferase [Lactococcus carnosus]MCJ1968891.1 acyltransferase [Lactococcus carnosus]
MGKKFNNFKGRIKGDLVYFALNSVVCYIPFWFIRRFFYQIFGLKLLKGSRISVKTVVVSPKKIILGKRVIINENCILDGRGGLIIGNDVSISMGSKIITASHKSSSSSFEYKSSETVIENNVWLGVDAIILDNSYLREGVIISAGSVFKGESERLGIYSGNLAKKVAIRKLKKNYEIEYHPFLR